MPRALTVTRWAITGYRLVRHISVLAAVLAVSANRLAVAADGIAPGTQFTPLAASVLTDPTPVLGTDGVFHLAYELLLTNATPASIKVETVEVRDARTHQVWLTLTGPTLLASMSPLVAGAATADTVIPSTGVGVVWLDVHVGSRAQVPRVLEHRVVAASGRVSSDAVVALVSTRRRAPVLLGPPVRGGMWLASEGCCSDDTHHRRGLAPVNGDLAVSAALRDRLVPARRSARTWIGDPSGVD